MLKKQYKLLHFLKKQRSYDDMAKYLGYKNFEELSNSKDWCIFDGDFLNCYDDDTFDNISGKNLAKINLSGLDKLEKYKQDQRRWRIPVIISVIALILSAAAIGLQLAQQLQLLPIK